MRLLPNSWLRHMRADGPVRIGRIRHVDLVKEMSSCLVREWLWCEFEKGGFFSLF